MDSDDIRRADECQVLVLGYIALEDPVAQVVAENVELSEVAVDRAVQDVKAPPGIRTASSTVKGVDQMTIEMPLRP